MTLTSTSTNADVYAAYKDSASYFELADTAKARAFITACIFLTQITPSRVMYQGQEIVLDIERLMAQQKTAQQWLSANAGVAGGGSGVKHSSFSGFRS